MTNLTDFAADPMTEFGGMYDILFPGVHGVIRLTWLFDLCMGFFADEYTELATFESRLADRSLVTSFRVSTEFERDLREINPGCGMNDFFLVLVWL